MYCLKLLVEKFTDSEHSICNARCEGVKNNEDERDAFIAGECRITANICICFGLLNETSKFLSRKWSKGYVLHTNKLKGKRST